MKSDELMLSSYVLPRKGTQSRLMVLVHGYGESPNDLTDRIEAIDPEGTFCVVVPTAPFQWKQKDIWHRAMNLGLEAEEQYIASVAALDALLGQAEERLGLAASEGVVGGFSQGGGLAIGLLVGATVQNRPAAGFGICSFPPMVQDFEVDYDAAAGRPYLLSSARADHFAPIEFSRESAALLTCFGLDVTYVEVEGGHEMTDQAGELIGEWLNTTGGVGSGKGT